MTQVGYWCMFIRKKQNKSGAVSVQILQKQGRINKLVRTIGSSYDPQIVNQLYKKAGEINELPRRKRTGYPTNSEESSLQAAGNLPSRRD